MRGCYIRTRDSEKSGCRGGVGSGYDSDSEEYALEIGQNCNAELPMLALCSHIDEILEFLNNSESSLAYLILKSMKDTEKDLERQLKTIARIPKTAGEGTLDDFDFEGNFRIPKTAKESGNTRLGGSYDIQDS
jgi:hypothetical protein